MCIFSKKTRTRAAEHKFVFLLHNSQYLLFGEELWWIDYSMNRTDGLSIMLRAYRDSCPELRDAISFASIHRRCRRLRKKVRRYTRTVSCSDGECKTSQMFATRLE